MVRQTIEPNCTHVRTTQHRTEHDRMRGGRSEPRQAHGGGTPFRLGGDGNQLNMQQQIVQVLIVVVEYV